MKYTAWIVIAVGCLMALYGVFTLIPMDPVTPHNAEAAGAAAGSPGAWPVPIATFLLPFGVVLSIVGFLMLKFGGSGVIKSRNLAVRN